MGEVDGPSPGGVTLFQGEFSTPTGWLDKPLLGCCRSGVKMGWLLRLVTGGPTGKGAPDSSRVLMINF